MLSAALGDKSKESLESSFEGSKFFFKKLLKKYCISCLIHAIIKSVVTIRQKLLKEYEPLAQLVEHDRISFIETASGHTPSCCLNNLTEAWASGEIKV
jgi:ribosomal protein S26